MSESGQSRTFDAARSMSELPTIADIEGTSRKVREVPDSDIRLLQSTLPHHGRRHTINYNGLAGYTVRSAIRDHHLSNVISASGSAKSRLRAVPLLHFLGHPLGHPRSLN
jgi:hypothetical protein